MNETTKAIIDNIFEELIALQESIDGGDVSVTTKTNETALEKVEMLTVKESAELIGGLSEHTVRQLVAQGKVKSVRTGEGKRGKILVNKADLVAYFNGKAV
ncbi:MAG: helix-turn-helix domain-containing protein [Ruminococcus flavefaciens]|nr:helix-turn-helix domain-containing protein [Ruminococcus flavefaciens]MCM1058777.1 helix-turn-helix domain-containing protein [Eubacterium sp.]